MNRRPDAYHSGAEVMHRARNKEGRKKMTARKTAKKSTAKRTAPRKPSARTSWEFRDADVRMRPFDDDLKMFEITDTKGDVYNLVPGNIRAMESIRADLNRGSDPLADGWEDGSGRSIRERLNPNREEQREAALSLYDGGWRANDRDELIANYNLSTAEADIICDRLAEIDRWDSGDDMNHRRSRSKPKYSLRGIFRRK